MMQLNTGADIPFEGLMIHQPTIKEWSTLGDENAIFLIYQVIVSAKKLLQGQDKINQKQVENFDIIMVILSRRVPQLKTAEQYIYSFLDLIFPYYEKELSEQQNCLILKHEKGIGTLNKMNYDAFVEIIKQIVNLEQLLGDQVNSGGYNPKGAHAQRIIEKLLDRKRRMAEQGKKQNNTDGLINRYMSILAVGLGFTWNEMSNFTLYQLLDTYKRFTMKEDYDSFVDAKMLGAKDIKDVPHWRSSFAEAEKQIKKEDKKEGRGKRRGNQIIME